MNLALLFEPSRALPTDADHPLPGTLGARVAGYRVGASFPTEWTTADVALLGVPEWRDDDSHAPRFDPAGPDAIRVRFYQLTPGTGPWHLVDLGNLRPGPTPADTAERLAEVVALLRRHGVLALILGGAHALTLGQHAGYEFGADEEAPAGTYSAAARPVRGALIDRAFDVAEHGAGGAKWLRALLLRDPNHLATLAHLASQRYHVTGPEATALDKMHFDVRRLGALHADLRAAEPLLRAADWLSIDAVACAHAAIPGAPGSASPFGLSAEQLCQLTWYAGHSRQLSSAGFYGYQPALDPLALGAMTLATAVWYLIEGYYHRPTHAPTEAPEHYTRYDVPLAGSTELLTFYQHPQTAQWWLLVEPPVAAPHVLPCTEEDYLTAARGEVPACWVQALARS
ncbi:MAG: arginase family protein [Hymenobacteraceae bacterium]|nr:arginase family protein [Hymenobacteraceae bacterium]